MPAYGRGGAGNIEAATTPAVITKAQNTALTSADPEKNAQSSAEKNLQNTEDYLESRTHLASYAGTPHDSLHNQQYAHMGRGGAGNYYSPWELQMRGEFTGAGTSHVLGDGTPQPKSQETESQKGGIVGSGEKAAAGEEKKVEGYRGRGGAGNFAYGVSESEERATRKRIEEEERKRQSVRQSVERGVEEGLARPEKAKLPLPAGQEI